MSAPRLPIFDLDGTLLDSDEALIAPFLALGVPAEELSFGHAVGPECERLGISLEDYVDAYDTSIALPFPGADALISRVSRWAVCSNKHPRSARPELARLRWTPHVAMFADAFGGASKRLQPVLAALDASADQVVFVGDTDHDRLCALEVGCEFYWAGWNRRTAESSPSGRVLTSPLEVLELL